MTAADFSQSDASRFGTEAFYASIGKAFVAMCAFVPILFVIELVDMQLDGHLDQVAGIQPRDPQGLDGIVFAPLLHVDYTHLVGNSIPLILMGTFVLAAGGTRFVASTILIALVSGIGVWIFSPSDTVTVGASGVIFGYLGVLLTRGLVEHSWWNIAVGLLIALLYGWSLLGVLPTNERISWQGHLFGFIGGVLAAIVFRRRSEGPGLLSRVRWRKRAEADA